MNVHQIKSISDIQAYVGIFNNHNCYRLPVSYFKGQKCFILESYFGDIKGGFSIIDKDMPRTLCQIPNHQIRSMYIGDVAELTGYFLASTTGRFKLKCRMAFECLRHRKKYFIYSYPSDNLKLKKYYGHGDPILLYDGPIVVDGDKKSVERIELLTKFGIFKILAKTTLRKLLK